MKISKYVSLVIYLILMANLLTSTSIVAASFLPVSGVSIHILNLTRGALVELWDKFSFTFVTMFILANYRDLGSVNIDKGFLTIYIIAGMIFSANNILAMGWLTFLMLIVIVYMLRKNKLNFGQHANLNYVWIIGLLFAIFSTYWLFMVLFVGKPQLDLYTAFLLSGLPFWISEEVIFRGMLWKNLDGLGWHPLIITIVQALLFWVSHVDYLLANPVLFWIQLPLSGIIYGVLVWRYRTIAPSTVAHILFNLR